ncbi:MAG: dehydrogenase [Anaerolineaceae bacterium]|nr:MAG: dehydrogenase [Anaerolineaceae bacterium]
MKKSRKNSEWATRLLGETLLFGLLGRLLYDQLDKTYLQSLIEEDVFADVPFGMEQKETKLGLEILQAWVRENRAGLTDESFDKLRTDYTSLLIGVGKVLAPPWESVYFNEDRMIFQQQTLQVREWYRRFGLEAEKLYMEPDDHIGLELSFLAHLSKLCLQAMEEKDEIKFEMYLQAQRQFLFEHPLKWIELWSGLVQEHSKTEFYRGLALLAQGALLAAAEHLRSELPKDVSL